MCRPASMIVTRTRVLWSRDGDSHEEIIRENGLSDRGPVPDFVRVEIVPPDDDYSIPLHRWLFLVDQDLLPDWWDPAEGEAAARAELLRWAGVHIIREGSATCAYGQTRVFLGSSTGTVTGGEATFSGSSQGTVTGGRARFLGSSQGTVTGGEAAFFGHSQGTVTGGGATFLDSSQGTVTGGEAWFYDNSQGTVTGGEAWFYGHSQGTVTGGDATFFYYSQGTVTGGEATFYDSSTRTNP